jgi:deferrochelatase/peroxidase EfeB
MRGGSYLVARRIRMRIETWDRSSLQDQNNTIGRTKVTGAPIGQTAEFDAPDFDITNGHGEPLIPADSHVRLANAISNDGERILRRGYSFTDGMDAYGQLDAGLFFIAYQRDPAKQFVRIQGTLAGSDALNEYISHTGSAIFACPRGMAEGEWIGQELFGSA